MVHIKKFLKIIHNCLVLLNLAYVVWVIGEGNGTPLQYSCLENPTDGGAW